MTYYNTTSEQGDTLDLFTKKAGGQNSMVLALFGASGVPVSPSLIWEAYSKMFPGTPLTSIRRAITTLAQTCKGCERKIKEGSSINSQVYCVCETPQPYLVKPSEKCEGKYGRPEYKWKIS